MTDVVIVGLALLGSSAVAVAFLTFFFRTNSVLRVSGWRSELLIEDEPEVEPLAQRPAPITLAEFVTATEAEEPVAKEAPIPLRPHVASDAAASRADPELESFPRAVASR